MIQTLQLRVWKHLAYLHFKSLLCSRLGKSRCVTADGAVTVNIWSRFLAGIFEWIVLSPRTWCHSSNQNRDHGSAIRTTKITSSQCFAKAYRFWILPLELLLQMTFSKYYRQTRPVIFWSWNLGFHLYIKKDNFDLVHPLMLHRLKTNGNQFDATVAPPMVKKVSSVFLSTWR